MTATTDADATAAGFQFTTEAVAGAMYYIGHNENFANYRSTDPDFVTSPLTPRLRIGLAHSANETDDQRDDVDFDAYRIRITDGNGDAVTEADDGNTTLPMHASGALTNRDGTLEPNHLLLTMVKVGWFGGTALAVGNVFAEPPDQYRDLPNDLLATDRTYTITAWAVNENDEVVSPVTSLKMRPVDTDRGAVTDFRDCQLASTVDLTDLVSTVSTVLK